MQGIAAGAFTVFCPKYINDITPIELTGPLGGINQFMCTFGIMVVGVLSLPIPAGIATDIDDRSYEDQFLVSQYWRLITLLPALFSFLQIVLLMTCFRQDSPKEYAEK